MTKKKINWKMFTLVAVLLIVLVVVSYMLIGFKDKRTNDESTNMSEETQLPIECTLDQVCQDYRSDLRYCPTNSYTSGLAGSGVFVSTDTGSILCAVNCVGTDAELPHIKQTGYC